MEDYHYLSSGFFSYLNTKTRENEEIQRKSLLVIFNNCIYTYICIHTHTYVYIHIYMHIQSYVYMYVYVQSYI